MRENDALREHNGQLQSQLYQYEEMLSKMNEEYQKLCVRLDSSNKSSFSLHNELSQAQIKNDESEKYIKRLNNEVAIFKSESNQKSAIIQQYKMKISDMESELAKKINFSAQVNKNET